MPIIPNDPFSFFKLLALYTSSYNSYEAGDKTTNTHKDLHTAKTNLNKAIAEMKKLQQELTEKKVHCQGVSEDLQEALSQLRSPDDQENRDENQLLNNVAEWFAESELDAMNSAMEMAHLASKNTKVSFSLKIIRSLSHLCSIAIFNHSNCLRFRWLPTKEKNPKLKRYVPLVRWIVAREQHQR